MSQQEALGIVCGSIPCDDQQVLEQALETLAKAGDSN